MELNLKTFLPILPNEGEGEQRIMMRKPASHVQFWVNNGTLPIREEEMATTANDEDDDDATSIKESTEEKDKNPKENGNQCDGESSSTINSDDVNAYIKLNDKTTSKSDTVVLIEHSRQQEPDYADDGSYLMNYKERQEKTPDQILDVIPEECDVSEDKENLEEWNLKMDDDIPESLVEETSEPKKRKRQLFSQVANSPVELGSPASHVSDPKVTVIETIKHPAFRDESKDKERRLTKHHSSARRCTTFEALQVREERVKSLRTREELDYNEENIQVAEMKQGTSNDCSSQNNDSKNTKDSRVQNTDESTICLCPREFDEAATCSPVINARELKKSTGKQLYDYKLKDFSIVLVRIDEQKRERRSRTISKGNVDKSLSSSAEPKDDFVSESKGKEKKTREKKKSNKEGFDELLESASCGEELDGYVSEDIYSPLKIDFNQNSDEDVDEQVGCSNKSSNPSNLEKIPNLQETEGNGVADEESSSRSTDSARKRSSTCTVQTSTVEEKDMENESSSKAAETSVKPRPTNSRSSKLNNSTSDPKEASLDGKADPLDASSSTGEKSEGSAQKVSGKAKNSPKSSTKMATKNTREKKTVNGSVKTSRIPLLAGRKRKLVKEKEEINESKRSTGSSKSSTSEKVSSPSSDEENLSESDKVPEEILEQIKGTVKTARKSILKRKSIKAKRITRKGNVASKELSGRRAVGFKDLSFSSTERKRSKRKSKQNQSLVNKTPVRTIFDDLFDELGNFSTKRHFNKVEIIFDAPSSDSEEEKTSKKARFEDNQQNGVSSMDSGCSIGKSNSESSMKTIASGTTTSADQNDSFVTAKYELPESNRTLWDSICLLSYPKSKRITIGSRSIANSTVNQSLFPQR